eukprot:gnl/Spiro4/3425_TR1670_c0_g1_i1.p1 gnl/Spiro4/3425_TR1670_c0_g1~~gnl/Spiro4/3425_TR1670_c0_g1_i1.p1  ORF type:complete len:125 (-),score=5.67 gnl/Spiro4/3425_TR1670_c0_g1_i1:120-494(-)
MRYRRVRGTAAEPAPKREGLSLRTRGIVHATRVAYVNVAEQLSFEAGMAQIDKQMERANEIAAEELRSAQAFESGMLGIMGDIRASFQDLGWLIKPNMYCFIYFLMAPKKYRKKFFPTYRSKKN